MRTKPLLVSALPMLWMSVFFIAPALILVKISLAQAVFAVPPYTKLFSPNGGAELQIFLDNYQFIAQDPLYRASLYHALKLAAISTLLCLVLGYPLAFFIANCKEGLKIPLLLAVLVPFWTSFLVRVYAWIGLLNDTGLINSVLIASGLTDNPIRMMQTNFATIIGITYTYFPFMVLPLYAVLEQKHQTLLEAATDIGATSFQAFRDITLPLSMPGVLVGCLLVFMPAVGEYIIPTLLGATPVIGRAVWDEFLINRDWPLAAALSIVIIIILTLPLIWLRRAMLREHR